MAEDTLEWGIFSHFFAMLSAKTYENNIRS